MTYLLQILQGLYFLSGIGLFVAAIIGLKQLTIAKETAKMNAKRESLKLANSQINFYLTDIIKLQDILDDEIEEKDVRIYKNAQFIIDGKKITVKLNSSKEEFKKITTITKPLLNVLNAMECFSSFFISGLADEEIAFKAVGKTFCNTARKLMPDLVLHAPGGYHTDVLDLFLLWNARLEKRDLQKKKETVEERLSKIDNKTITPLGT